MRAEIQRIVPALNKTQEVARKWEEWLTGDGAVLVGTGDRCRDTP